MQLQKDPQSMAKPSNLPAMEIVKDKAAVGKVPFKGMSTPDWMPSYVKPTLSKVRSSMHLPTAKLPTVADSLSLTHHSLAVPKG